MTKALSIDDNFRGQWVDGDILTISYEYSEVTVNIMEGKGKVTRFRATPLIAQMVKLHKETSKWWIYFSDSFGAGILVMAVTGMFIEKGKFSFRSRGWKLAIAGIIFPLLFLFFFS